MYTQYLETDFGYLEIICSDEYVISVLFVDEILENRENEITKLVAIQLIEYFNKQRTRFDLPILFNDSFFDVVRHYVYQSEYGTTISYKSIGLHLNSKAYQAIGSAMAKNKLVIIIPCHRVINNNGELGQYRFTTKLKKRLINFEQSRA